MTALAVLASFLLAQAKPQMTEQDKAIRKYLAGKAAELEKDFLPGVKTAEDFEKLRPRLRSDYFYMLGLDPMPDKTPLKPVVTGRIDGDGYTVENLHFQSRPGLYVTANLYLPKPAKGPYPAIMYACGHSGMKRDGNKTAYQDHGIWFATHGYVCLVTDTLQLGEIAAIHHGTYREQRWWWHSAGYTSAGVECWNGIRAVDYLLSRAEVDPEKIGATGISGGGAATFWLAAADPRVKTAAPVSGMADLGYYVAEDGVDAHCDCMLLYNKARWNWTTIAALVCPRPMLFVNSDNDRIFPMSANERISNRLEWLYARFGASDIFDTMVSVGGHAYRTDIRRAVFEFFNRHLKGDSRRVEDADSGLGPDPKTRRIPTAQLRVFPEDRDVPADQLNTRIDETFVPRAKVELPKPEGFENWRRGLVSAVRNSCFAAWPAAIPPLAVGELTTVPESGVSIGFNPRGHDSLVILDAPDETLLIVPEWAKPYAGPDAALVKPRGGWTRRNPPNTVERALACLGSTADSGRAWDIRAAAQRYRRLIGRGDSGVLAAYSALFEPSVREIVVIDPPASHYPSGPHFLNVLRVLDIPEALGLLAPRKLTLVNAKDPAFDRTAEIYRIAGAADKLERK
jgi:dienelactone hydrolase